MLSLKWVSIVGGLLYCCLGLSQMVVAQTFDQDYADWKATQVAQDQRLQHSSTAQQAASDATPQGAKPTAAPAPSPTISTTTAAQSNPSAHPVATAMLQVHLNRDSVEQLQQLKGIGAKKAQAIVEYRQQHGPFQSIEELKNVKGIGTQTFEKNRTQLAL